jgi:PHD/YefM family antitoxin component YafN of YafNO toxin-antitoxin module
MERTKATGIQARTIKRAHAPFYVTEHGKDIALVIPGEPSALATIEVLLNKRIMKDIAEASADFAAGRRNYAAWEKLRVSCHSPQKRRG